MADPDERALAARETLHHQLCAHQIAAAGGGFWHGAGGRRSESGRISAGDDSLLDQLADPKVADITTRDAWIALRDKIRAEQKMVIVFGSELRGHDIEKW